MSAPRHAPPAPDTIRPEIRPSLALVPLPARHAPPAATPAGSGPGAVTVLYGLGYTALFLILAGSVVGGWNTDGRDMLYVLGGILVILPGCGILVHTLSKPTERGFRRLLLALGALAATLLAADPILRAAEEVRAAGQVAALQPLADELVRFGRLERWGRGYGNGHFVIDGYRSTGSPDLLVSDADSLGRTRNAVLLAGGATPGQFNALVDRLQSSGVSAMEMVGGGVALRTDGHGRETLFYLPSGRGRRPADPVFEAREWGSTPLGGGWYLLR